MTTARTPYPFDPYCGLYAADMPDLDPYVADVLGLDDIGELAPDQRRAARAAYVAENDGTFNATNGHFACDVCYMRLGGPSGADGQGGPGRWVAP